MRRERLRRRRRRARLPRDDGGDQAGSRPRELRLRRRALETYGVDSVEDVEGDTAIARYGPLPAALKDIPGLPAAGLRLRMQRIDGRWLVASLPY